MGFLAIIKEVGAGGLVLIQPVNSVDPGFGVPGGGVDPGYGHPGGGGHPGNALPVPPVKPTTPIVLPPGTWPPQVPPGLPDLPPHAGHPIVIPPDPDLGIEQPIYLPELPPGVALLIALPQAAPKEGTPPGTKPALLVQFGKKPVLVYVSAAPTPK